VSPRWTTLAGAAFLLPLLAACESRYPSDRFADERERMQREALAALERDGYGIHRHERPEFVVAYPASLVQPLGGTVTGEGQRFASADGRVTMTAEVDGDADGAALRRIFQQETGGNGAAAGTMPAGDRFVVTRRVDGRMRYVKAALRDGHLSVLTIEYDTTHTAQVLDAVPRIASVFPP